MGVIGEHFESVKQHWARNFAFLDYFKKVYGRAEPLPKWSDADVDEFIASDPVYGPQLKALRESRKFALAGALVGAAHLGGVAIKYSKAPHGVVLATGFGAITGAVLGSEVAAPPPPEAMARSPAPSSSSYTDSSGSSSDSGSSSSGSDRRRHRHRHRHRSSRRKEGASSSALKARKDGRSRHKRRRHERERRRSPSDDDSYSSTSSYDSDREASSRSRKHKKSSRSRKSRERERSKDGHHKRDKSKHKEKKESEHAGGPVQLSKFLGRDKEKEEGTQRSAISGKKIMMKLEKTKEDKAAESKRNELLKFLNASYD